MSEDEKPQLVEKTSKKYKLIQLVGFAIALPGLALFPVSAAYESGLIAGISCGIFLGGVSFVIYGNILAWWHHG